MRHLATAICALIIAVSTIAVYAADKAPVDRPEFTSAQVRKMTREAHTVEQFTVLADYYATRRRMYKRKAAEEMHLWAVRSTVITPLSEKWPRPVDSARNLYDYYEYKANEAAAEQAKYSKLADEAAFK